MDVVASAAGITRPPPTCRRNGQLPALQGEGISRIDLVFANKVGATLIRGVRYLYHTSTMLELQHIPIAMDLDLQRFSAMQSIWIKPMPFPFDKLPILKEDEAEVHFRNACRPEIELFQQAIEDQELDTADQCWHRLATSYLHSLCTLVEAPLPRGGPQRGSVPTFENVKVSAPQLKGWAVGAAPHYLKELEAMKYRGKELLVKLNRIECMPASLSAVPAVNMAQTHCLWRRIRNWTEKKLPRSLLNTSPPGVLPKISVGEDIVERISDKLRKMAISLCQRRKKNRAPFIQRDVATNYSKGTFRFIRNKIAIPLTAVILESPDFGGSKAAPVFTAVPVEIHEAFRSEWSSVFNRHVHVDQDALVADYMDRYSHHIPYVPFKPADVSGLALWERVQQAPDSSDGLDGWSRKELRLLPLPVWTFRAQLIKLSENIGRWPVGLCFAYQSHPSKIESSATIPLDTRPIRVYSHLQRDYIAIRYAQLRPWQGKWIHPAAHGGRKNHEVQEPVFEVQLEIQEAL